MIKSKYLKFIPDKTYLKLKYRIFFKQKLNLNNPQTLNEKINWLKLYNRKKQYITIVDKNKVKKYVEEKIGKEYIIPTLGIYEKFEDIDIEKMPNQFVIKCTHDSGGLVICKNKNEFNKKEAKNKIEKCLKTNYFYHAREWPYKNVRPKIMVEKYMEDKKNKELRDYKFLCFNGMPKLMFIATDRQKRNEPFFDFFDMDFNHLDIKQGHPNNPIQPEKPKNFEKMKKLAEVLSKNIPFVRVDFYEVDGKIYFGELTLSHFSGMMPFEPNKWDNELGRMLTLPKKDKRK